MFSSVGVIQYFDFPIQKVIVEVDPEIVNYYKKLVPRYYRLQPQRYPPHISVIRNENILNLSAWKKYQNQEIFFFYHFAPQFDSIYAWLTVVAPELKFLRQEIGLAPVKKGITLSPDDKSDFHITIGNFKK